MAHFIEDMIGPSGGVSPEENAQMRQATPSDWQQAAELQEAQRREDAARRQQQAMQAQRRATIDENGTMFNNIVQTDAGVRQRAGQLQRRAAVGLLSAYKLGASVDGGRVPPSVYTMIGGMLGYDNKTSGIGNIQVDMDGSMTIVPFASVNDQLQMQDPIKLPFETMYGMGLENQGVLTADEMTALRNNAVSKLNLTEDMANRMYPAVPEGYGNPNYVPVGGRDGNGAINVGRAFSRGPRVKGGGGSFFSDGKGGFIRTRSDASTGFQTVEERSGTLADDYKGRWKVLRGGGGQTTYKNDKTGDVVTVRDGETPPWVANSGTSERERIARINADAKIKVAEKANETKIGLADAANVLKKYGIDVSAQLKERGLDISQQNADARSSVRAGGARFDKDRYAALKERHDALALDADGNPRADLSDKDKARIAVLEEQMDSMLDGGKSSDVGSDEALTPQQKAAQVLQARQGAQPAQGVSGNVQQMQGTQQAQGETKVPTADSVKKAVQESPGNITEDEEGMRSAIIKNYEYLSEEDRKSIKPRYQESETENFDETVVNAAQKKANEAKAAVDAARKEEEDKVRKALSGKGWTQTRIDNAMRRHMKKWDEEHDAATRKKNEENESLYRAFISSFD